MTGADAGGGPHVRVYEPDGVTVRTEFFPYSPSFSGGVRVAAGDVTGGGAPDIITAPGPGGGPHIRVFSSTVGLPVAGAHRSFFAYAPEFTGGVNLATGDVNADGFDDIITGADAGGGPHVRVFSGLDGRVLLDLMAFDPSFRGGVRVAAGDVDFDGHADVITAAGPGGGPHVRVFSGATGAPVAGPLGSFFAYAPNFQGGVYVASGRINGHGADDILTGAGAGGGPHVNVFNALDGSVRSFFAYGTQFTGGVRVGIAGNHDEGFARILTSPGPSGGPHVRILDPHTFAPVHEFFAYNEAFRGGVFGAGIGVGFRGSSSGEFVSPEPETATFTNRGNSISWGVPGDEGMFTGQSSLFLAPRTFGANTNQPTPLATLTFVNRATFLETVLTGVDLRITLSLTDSSGTATEEIVVPIDILNTLNNEDPVDSGDYINLSVPLEPVIFEMPDGSYRILEILGFTTPESAGQAVTQLFAPEGGNTQATLIGQLYPVRFEDGPFTQGIPGCDGTETDFFAFGSSWTRSDILSVTSAIKILRAVTGNTRLLSRTGGTQTFVRWGYTFPRPVEGFHLNVRLGSYVPGTIFLSDLAFRAPHIAIQTVLHEIGHHWDIDTKRATVGFSEAFNKFSLWHGPTDPCDGPMTADDTTEIFDPRQNSLQEDFAVSFAVYILSQVSGTYEPDGPGGPAPAIFWAARALRKMSFMERFINSV